MKPVTRRSLRQVLEHAARGALVVAAGCESSSSPPPPPMPPPPSPPVESAVPPPAPVVVDLPFGCVDGRWDGSAAFPAGAAYLGDAGVLAQKCSQDGSTAGVCASPHLKPYQSGMFFRYHMVVVRGDEVSRVENAATLLGPIDTPTKAALRLRLEGQAIDCEATTVRASGDAFLVTAKAMTSDCPIQYSLLTFKVARDGTLQEVARELIPGQRGGVCAGRRPTGYAPLSSSGASAGVWLARSAGLEAASVHAFHELADDLVACGAPGRLVAQARVFADDEVRHAALTDGLAARFGGRRDALPERPRVRRSLLEIAVDNAVEGCVRETFGALLAMVQAASATDGAVARGMAEIADEELSHAAFSWELAAWANERLAPAERRAVTALAEAELARFDPAADAPADGARAALGWPTPAALEQLRLAHAEAVRALWA